MVREVNLLLECLVTQLAYVRALLLMDQSHVLAKYADPSKASIAMVTLERPNVLVHRGNMFHLVILLLKCHWTRGTLERSLVLVHILDMLVEVVFQRK
mmetsp:Transcript_1019/g.2941  ORF Transcript_1019/g.2941 Transcript_1019/m.2941 type:complete len:98 (-) Transcript_1019:698-991(-)